FNNGVMMLFAALNAPFLGVIIDFTRNGKGIQLSDYTLAFSILVAIGFVSLLFPLFFIRETFCKSKGDFTILTPFGLKKKRISSESCEKKDSPERGDKA